MLKEVRLAQYVSALSEAEAHRWLEEFHRNILAIRQTRQTDQDLLDTVRRVLESDASEVVLAAYPDDIPRQQHILEKLQLAFTR